MNKIRRRVARTFADENHDHQALSTPTIVYPPPEWQEGKMSLNFIPLMTPVDKASEGRRI